MSSFLESAYQVLHEEGVPLSAKEITTLAMERGLLTSEGATPAQTMKSKLSTELRKRGERSPFMRTEPARFGLRDWKGRYVEYHAVRFEKALFDEDIVVFPREHLGSLVPGPGLHPSPSESVALRSILRPMRRRAAEDDMSVVQLISVFVIRYQDRVLTYKRTKRLPESRLRGEYSIGFGGHLNPDDIPPLFDILQPDQSFAFIERELREEVKLPPGHLKRLVYSGLLYDDSRPVSRQHLGIVYEVRTTTPEFEIGERGFLMDARYEALSDIGGRIDEFENWSVILYEHLSATPTSR